MSLPQSTRLHDKRLQLLARHLRRGEPAPGVGHRVGNGCGGTARPCRSISVAVVGFADQKVVPNCIPSIAHMPADGTETEAGTQAW
jgi:hypothetical protein